MQESVVHMLKSLHKLLLDGWNNNPTALQFQHIFKRLISHCGVTPGTTGNALPLEDVSIIQAGTTSASSLDGGPVDAGDTVAVDRITYLEVHDHPYCSHRLSCFLENIVCYIAGMSNIQFFTVFSIFPIWPLLF